MEPELRRQKLIEIERMNKLSSIMAHPEWEWFVGEFITKPLERFEKDAHKSEFRSHPDQYINIVRALEKVELYQSFTRTMDHWIKRGREAQLEIDKEDGRS